MATAYTTKCIATQVEHKALGQGMQRYTDRRGPSRLEDACGGKGPPPCAHGDEQLVPLYAEAAGAYHALRNDGVVVVNIVRTCLRAQEPSA